MRQNDATIFLVDDDASVLRALKRLLKSAGFNAEAISAGLGGWRKMFRCKAHEILRNVAYLRVRCNDDG